MKLSEKIEQLRNDCLATLHGDQRDYMEDGFNRAIESEVLIAPNGGIPATGIKNRDSFIRFCNQQCIPIKLNPNKEI